MQSTIPSRSVSVWSGEYWTAAEPSEKLPSIQVRPEEPLASSRPAAAPRSPPVAPAYRTTMSSLVSSSSIWKVLVTVGRCASGTLVNCTRKRRSGGEPATAHVTDPPRDGSRSFHSAAMRALGSRASGRRVPEHWQPPAPEGDSKVRKPFGDTVTAEYERPKNSNVNSRGIGALGVSSPSINWVPMVEMSTKPTLGASAATGGKVSENA